MIERAMIAGLNSTGVESPTCGAMPSAVGRHLLKTHDYAAGFHVGFDAVEPGARADPLLRGARDPDQRRAPEGDREALHARRAASLGRDRRRQRRISGAGAGELRGGPARDARPGGDPRRASSASSSTTATRRRRSCCRSCSARSASRPSPRTRSRRSSATAPTASLRGLIGQTKKLVSAVGADLGVVFDRAAERLYLIDESGHEIPVEQALLLFLRLIGSDGRRGKLAFPVTVTSQVDQIVKGSGLQVVRTPRLAERADEGRRRGRRDLRRRGRRRLRLPGLPARLRRDGEPLQAPRAPGARASSRSRRSSRSCPPRRSSTASCPARGRTRAR